ncbi:Metallophosphoesterase domain-containing protein 1 [Seminavis robusta]|uniref:Metallophosphoesterase domain-containing protein 1 n=1 Tax=Seminavis robusta TaxID=568900 RepID=A0A9N8E0V2_9STRA|nr:Metallophosphoesterase domain-containing protein 1 [Seminavis robusta]|eukprot:Sro538_g162480.1 Metallophosphoesterase domain-containing protein 1 (509) ;mRNA; r:5776-7302
MADDDRPKPSFFAGIAAFNRKASLKKAVTQVTKRDGSVVEETLADDGSYLRATKNDGEAKDMSYLERSASPPPSDSGKNQERPNNNVPLNPDAAWRTIASEQQFLPVPTVSTKDSLWKKSKHGSNNCTRIVCMSDTHGQHRDISVPKGDILIHGGDFTSTGEIKHIKDMLRYFEELAFPVTVCIAGNHDMTLDLPYYDRSWRRFHRKKRFNAEEGRQAVMNMMNDTTTTNTDKTKQGKKPEFYYLEDSSCTVPIGSAKEDDDDLTSQPTQQQKEGDHDSQKKVKFNPSVVVHKQPKTLSIYGSPWSPEFYDWAFNVARGEPSWKIWSKIPSGTDILVTHGPPLGRGDQCDHGGRAGCYDLLEQVQNRVRPRLHIFGHIHEGYGTSFDGTTLYINASNLDLGYDSVHPCTVVDLPHDPALPPRIVEPSCSITGDDLVNGWFRDKGYEILADVLRDSGCEGQNLPSGDELLNTAEAYWEICRQLDFRTTTSLQAKRELRKALSQLYAASF